MKFTRKFLEGGAMPAEDPAMAGAPAEAPVEASAEGGDPMMQLAELFALGLLNQDCLMLALGAQMFLEMASLALGGGAPAEALGEPVYRRGGKLAYRIKK